MEITTLCYIEKDNKYLMLHRNKRKKDINGGKWIGLGGHCLEGEDPDSCVVREVEEESGLKIIDYKLCGKITFVIDDLEEICYLYKVDSFSGELIECDEGDLHWVEKEKVLDLNLWEGDHLFLEKLINNDNYFEMKLNYENGNLISHKIKE